MLAIGPKVHGFKPGYRRRIFKGDKNTFHQRVKSSCQPCVVRIYGMLKNLQSVKEILHKANFIISFTSSSCFATRQLCWCHGALVDESVVFPVNIIPSLFSMLIYQLGDEQ
jgi:hypothetical protein